MIEAFNIMQDRLTRMRLAGDPPDVHITPHIGHRVLGTAALASVIVVLLMSYQMGPRNRISNDTSDPASPEMISPPPLTEASTSERCLHLRNRRMSRRG